MSRCSLRIDQHDVSVEAGSTLLHASHRAQTKGSEVFLIMVVMLLKLVSSGAAQAARWLASRDTGRLAPYRLLIR